MGSLGEAALQLSPEAWEGSVSLGGSDRSLRTAGEAPERLRALDCVLSTGRRPGGLGRGAGAEEQG